MVSRDLRDSLESDGGRACWHVVSSARVMAESPMELFRCPTCGELVPLTANAKRVCAKCGHEFSKPIAVTPRVEGHRLAEPDGKMVQRDVVTSKASQEWTSPGSPLGKGSGVGSGPDLPIEPSRPEPSAKRGNLHGNTKKRTVNPSTLLLHLGGWSALLMLIAIGVKFRMGDTDSELPSKGEKQAELVASMEEGMRRFLAQELPSVKKALLSYLAESSWAGRAQFVSNSSDVAPKMQRHYRSSRMWTLIPGSSLIPVSANVIRVPGGNPIIETLFRIESSRVEQGAGSDIKIQSKPYLREVVFLRERNRWKIDWEALVRHSPQSWSLFYSDVEGGNQPGEFRLFARQITTRVQEGTPVMVLKFYQLRDNPEEIWKQETPPVVVERDSESGRLFYEIFQRDASRTLPGASRLWHRDPENLRRVRVRLRWETSKDGERYLVVDKVLAANWLSAVVGEGSFTENFSGGRGSSEREKRGPGLESEKVE